MSTAARTIYLTIAAAPGELATHLTITRILGTLAAQVVATNPETREVLHDVTVRLSVIDRSIVSVPTSKCSSGFLLHAGRYTAGITFDQINTIRRWTTAVIDAAAA
jgi:hypothetical protein